MGASGPSRMAHTLIPATTIRANRNGTTLDFHPLGFSAQRWNHTAAPTAEPTEELKRPHISTHYERRVVEQSKKEMLDMVDYYDDEPVDEYMKFYGDPFLRTYASANGPNITISDKKEDLELQTINGDRGPDDKQFEPARNLQSALASWHRRPSQHFLDTIWDLYQALPEPRPAHMHARTRHSLMAALASVERRDLKSMLRYFAVVADVKNSGFSLTRVQWNKALSFASRYVATTTEVELEAALKLWRSMEKEANIRGNEATFNILFDCASKAGKFDLAEMIYKEMARRGFAFNRFHHVSLIHFLGLKMDSNGVRAAYKEMVEAGEIIDTVVLNCLIASFIRCGEEQSAEYVYEKMKASSKDLPVPPHRDYTMGKAIKKVLGMFARVGKQYPSMLPEFQKSALLSPDLHTYRILLYHYGLRLGSLSKVVQFLDEMSAFTVPFNGMVFLILFRSFAKHGGAGSEWSAQRLNRVWEAFLNALDSEVDGLYISTWLAMAVLKAHARYATKDEMLDVFDCLRSRWELDSTNTQYMLQFLQSLLKTGRFACVF
ncbi:hypothetical protein NUW58_g6215 [Xylaria curta]|uniref:Uncharacterized protein n=1 Tax=Xylaria curta TaxID=42375 RepID=A0ACC1NXK5_9PEZI|nr:hypothetical protein NUW58_g6215 [Xylaria curta]